MRDQQFEEMDDAMRESMKKVLRPQIPAEILKDFSVDVAEKIKERQNERMMAPKKRLIFGLKMLVPAFAAVLLFVTAVSRMPLSMTSPGITSALSAASLADISKEIAALKAVGAWTDEDERLLASDESVLEQMEIG